jgi:RIO kinase 1
LSRIRTQDWLNEDFDPRVPRRRADLTKGLRGERADRYSDQAIIDEILAHADDPEAQAAAFNPTYQGARYERVWIRNYLGAFYDRRLISDVLRKVKGGKEATVYCCSAGSLAPGDLVAAKIYRPRQFRNLRNDALYRQGREILGARGQPVRDRRALVAIREGTRKGKEMEHVSWLAHEYASLRALHAAGVPVPEPIAFANNTVLMEYCGDAKRPAPALHSVRLSLSEARDLFASLLRDVETMLANGRIHADLSAFNVLYWRGEYRIIDFPQSVDPATHDSAFELLQRDVTRICQYFARYGIASHASALAQAMWERQMI